MIDCCFSKRIIDNYLPLILSGGNHQISLPKFGEEPKKVIEKREKKCDYGFIPR
jgi:hypothetical protein